MTTALIIRNDTTRSIAFTGEAERLKNEALEAAAVVGSIQSHEQHKIAVAAQTKLNDTLRSIEKARKEAKDPILEYGRQIDASAKALCAEMVAEKERIDASEREWLAAEDARVRAAQVAAKLAEEVAEKKRQYEIERVRREEEKVRQEAQAKIDAERKKLAEEERQAKEAERQQREKVAEEQRKADAIKNDSARAEAKKKLDEESAAREKEEKLQAEARAQELADLEREQRRAEELAKAKSTEAMAQIQEKFHAEVQAAESKVTGPSRVSGQTVRSDWEIESIDVHTLYRHHPYLVKLEPNLSELKSALDEAERTGTPIRGVKAKRGFKTTTRTTTQPKAIDVASEVVV